MQEYPKILKKLSLMFLINNLKNHFFLKNMNDADGKNYDEYYNFGQKAKI